MKLPQLLSQYLYQTRQMDLPGIGSFTLDAGAVIPQESDRIGQVPASGISFKNANIPAADDALITFIKDHTGKMKSLAAADLDFFLTTGRQLLNIGKPFYLEGIGTLLKNKDGRLDFTPGEYLVAKLEEPVQRGGIPASERRSTTGATAFDEPPREEPRSSANGRQTVLLVGLVAALILIAWGGYYLYKKNNYVEPSSAENKAKVFPDSPGPANATPSADSTAAAKAADSTGRAANTGGTASTATPASNAPAPGAPGSASSTSPGTAAANTPVKTDSAKKIAPPPVVLRTPTPTEGQSLYRFVILRTENKGHALRRYNQLLGYQLNIHMDQKDSSFFKLYFPIAAAPRDTTYIKDSLADVYASRVTIEQ